MQIKGNKGAAHICEKISELFRDKGIELSNMRFSGLDGTNSMSGERDNWAAATTTSFISSNEIY